MTFGHGARGASWSILLHGAIVLALVVLGVTLESEKRVVVIDFSVKQSDAPSVLSPGTVAAPTKPMVPVAPPPPQAAVKKEKPPVKKVPAPEVRPPAEPVKPKPRKEREVVRKKAEIEPPVTSKSLPKLPSPSKTVTQPEPAPVQPSTAQPERPVPVLPTAASAEAPLQDLPATHPVPISAGPAGGTGLAGPSGSRPSVSPDEGYVAAHFDFIRKEIQEKIVYPVMARRMGWQGRVKLSFGVELDGSICDLEVMESCGYRLLDDCALTSVKKAVPFPRPPVRARLIIPVIFRLTL